MTLNLVKMRCMGLSNIFGLNIASSLYVPTSFTFHVNSFNSSNIYHDLYRWIARWFFQESDLQMLGERIKEDKLIANSYISKLAVPCKVIIMPGVTVLLFLQALRCTQVEGGCHQLPGHEGRPGGAGHVSCLLEHHILQG